MKLNIKRNKFIKVVDSIRTNNNLPRNKFIKVVDSIRTNSNLTFMICYKNVIKIL